MVWYRKAEVVGYRKAAERDNAEAQYALGRCYENGAGVPKDPAQAVVWYRKAAEQGFATAQYTLGRCYRYGIGVLKNEKLAREWFCKSGITRQPRL